MARTADIQVRARRGRTTQELQSDALQVGGGGGENKRLDEMNSRWAAISLLFLRHLSSVRSRCLIVRLHIKAHHQYTCNGTDEGDKHNALVYGEDQ